MNIFSVNSDVQDVEILLNNTAEVVRQWEGGEAPPLDLTVMLGEAGRVSQRASRLKGQWNLNSWAIIQSNRPGLGPWIIRFQHIIRKLTWWFLEPIIMQIRTFQMNTAMTIDGLAQNQESILNHIQEQAVEIAAMKKHIEELESGLKSTESQ